MANIENTKTQNIEHIERSKIYGTYREQNHVANIASVDDITVQKLKNASTKSKHQEIRSTKFEKSNNKMQYKKTTKKQPSKNFRTQQVF